VDESLKCRLLLALADTVWSAGQTTTARKHYLHAAEVARRTGDARLFAAAAVGLGGRYPGLQINVIDGTLVALLEEAMARLEGTDEPPVPEVMARLAEALTFSPEAAQRRVGLARLAIAAARRRNDPAELARVLQHVHLPLWDPDNVEERLAMSTEMEMLARRSDDTGVSLAARGWRLVHLMEIGDIETFRREVADYAATAEELQQPVYRYVAHLRHTLYLLLEGRFEEAEACAAKTMPLGEQAQVSTAVQAFGAQTFNLRMVQGRLAELLPAVSSLAETYPDAPAWRVGLAVVHAETDQRESAQRQLDRLARHDFADLPRDLNYNCNLALLAVVVSYLDDRERAARLLPLLLPHAGRCALASGSAPLGSSSTFLGILATTLGDFAEAERHLEEGLEMNTRIGSRPWAAYTGHRLARMLHARNDPGDRERAAGLLEWSEKIARALGMARLVSQIGTLRTGFEPRAR
jgi:tetratricopeptide (TPR) repeat protein